MSAFNLLVRVKCEYGEIYIERVYLVCWYVFWYLFLYKRRVNLYIYFIFRFFHFRILLPLISMHVLYIACTVDINVLILLFHLTLFVLFGICRVKLAIAVVESLKVVEENRYFELFLVRFLLLFFVFHLRLWLLDIVDFWSYIKSFLQLSSWSDHHVRAKLRDWGFLLLWLDNVLTTWGVLLLV